MRAAIYFLMIATLGCGTNRAGFDAGGEPQEEEMDAGEPMQIDPSDADNTPQCVNLQCQQVKCSSGTTSISGTVVTPTPMQYGEPLPLYNVVVYVPNQPIAPLKDGIVCNKCNGVEISGAPVTLTTTDSAGKFTLKDVPAGTNIPLVMQLGKWRKQITIPSVPQCVDTKLPQTVTKMPSKKSEGNIPHIGFSSGGWDPHECLLLRIGIDPAEFTSPMGNGRVHFFKGSGADLQGGTVSSQNLWTNFQQLKQYDLVIGPCNTFPPNGAGQAVLDYANGGGRAFFTDLSRVWLDQSSPIPEWQPASNWTGGQPSNPTIINQAFPRGKAMAEWLVNVGASSVKGELPMNPSFLFGYNDSVAMNTTTWVHSPNASPKSVQTWNFNTPYTKPMAQQCGKVYYSAFHVSQGAGTPSGVFPNNCTTNPLSPQEKALIFLLFDSIGCVQDDMKPAEQPPIK